MFESRRPRSTADLAFNMAILTFHTTARKVRQRHGNAVMSIMMSLFQSIMFVAAFYLMFSVLGMRGAVLRGDFFLYLVSGIFLFLTHAQAVGQVSSAEGPATQMMLHAPMNTLVAIISSALASLYIQTISLTVILLIIHVVSAPLEFYYWPGALMMYLLAWASGVGVGLVFLAAKPWAPDVIEIVKLAYIRANMLASGKMFVANMMPSAVIAYFDWNPLFHVIDQARGFTFRNYFPHFSNWEYPVYATIVLIMVGFMIEAYTRQHASASWDAKR